LNDSVFIGGVKINGRLSLAPMAGVSDSAFRVLCAECGAALLYTEMVSAKALTFRDKKTAALLKISAAEHPIGAQIFGSEPDCMAMAAPLAIELSGADFIDVNMGCPVGKIAGNGEGGALMKNPALAAKIIEAVKKSVTVPVTVKIRKGWDSGSVNAVEFAKICESAGADAVAVHGRTRVQMYSGRADWDIIREVKAALKIPVFANGDVFEPGDAEQILKHTGADMAMIGRGSFGNPWIFTKGNAVLNGRDVPPRPPISDRMDAALRQIELAVADKGEKIALLEARRYLCWYLKGVSYAGYFKKQIVAMENIHQAREIVAGVKRELR
jgi:tRNA-dihydrouridine synthase B